MDGSMMMRKLAAIQGYNTRYEAVMILADGRTYRIGYLGRKSRSGLLACIRTRGPRILAVVDMPDDAVMTWKAGAMHLGEGTVIKFSGRTQRDAICNGELARLPD
jgi:hypothetical protein